MTTSAPHAPLYTQAHLHYLQHSCVECTHDYVGVAIYLDSMKPSEQKLLTAQILRELSQVQNEREPGKTDN